MTIEVKKAAAILFALVCWLPGVCQTHEKRNFSLAYCVKEKDGGTGPEKDTITQMFKAHIDLMHKKPSRSRLVIWYIPDSGSKEKLDAAKTAVNEISKLATGMGIKRQRKVYWEYNPDFWDKGDCTGIQLLIFLYP